jgi:hypothetical protein
MSGRSDQSRLGLLIDLFAHMAAALPSAEREVFIHSMMTVIIANMPREERDTAPMRRLVSQLPKLVLEAALMFERAGGARRGTA